MRLDTDTTTQGTMMGEAQPLSFDPDSMAHMMMLLSANYSSSGEAVMREYANNARDSHIAAGSDEPIEVSLPQYAGEDITVNGSTNLVVTDRGVGLTRSGVTDLLGRYVASSKRDSDKETGALGIGAKSGYAISSQFSVTAVKDGVRTLALFTIGENDTPMVTILDESPTAEPNGVQISIPVSEDHARAMHRSLLRVFGMWPRGSVLVDGEEPERIEFSTRFGPVGFTDQNLGADEKVLVEMNGSLYGCPPEVAEVARDAAGWNKMSHRLRTTMIVSVPLSDPANIAPSREHVRDTPRTRRVVAEACGRFVREIKRQIRSAPDLAHQAQIMGDVARTLVTVPITRGPLADQRANMLITTPVGSDHEPNPYMTYLVNSVRSSARNSQSLKAGEVTSPHMVNALSTLFVLGSTSATRTHLKKWSLDEEVSADFTYVVITEKDQLELCGQTVTAEDPRGFHVMGASDLRTMYRQHRLPKKETGKKEIIYTATSLGNEGRDGEGWTPSEISEDSAGRIVVICDDPHSFQYARRSVRLQLEEEAPHLGITDDHLFIEVAAPRTESALRNRLADAGFGGTIVTWRRMREQMADPVRDLSCEAHRQVYYRSGALKALARRIDELDEPARSIFNAAPIFEDGQGPTGLTKEYASLLKHLCPLPVESIPSDRELSLGSKILSERISISRYQWGMRGDSVGDEDVSDLIAIINSRAARMAADQEVHRLRA